MGRPLRSRLAIRLAVALGLAAGSIVIAAGVWNLRLQRAQLTRLVVTGAAERAEDIRRATREAMMRNSPGEVRKIIETIASQPSIERIRLYDKRGRIRTSSDASEIGTLVDTVAEQCVLCHQQTPTLERVEDRERTRIFHGPDGGRLLGVVAPIRNEPACADAVCHAHPPEQSVLGVLDIQLSLAGVDQNLAASERQMLLGLLGTTLGALAAVWLLTWHLVLKPVGRLTEAVSRVAAGELSSHLPTSSEDEIGEMTEAWNTMIAKLGRAHIVLERWSKILEQRVDEKTAELERAHQQMLQVEKMASLGRLAAVMAHEINNPLTGIATYARLMRKRLLARPQDEVGEPGVLSSDTEEILKLIEDESVRCGAIVRNLLLFSRTPGAGFAEAQLNTLLERSTLLLQPQSDRAGVKLKLEADPDLPRIPCDSSQIQQMILALAINAIEATPAGGTVTISSALAGPADGVVLRVVDSGRGIPPDKLHRIFEPFYTTKPEGSGIGLGLAVAYGIVSRHHGTIDVESSVDTGTTFSIQLPLSHPGEPDDSEADQDGRSASE